MRINGHSTLHLGCIQVDLHAPVVDETVAMWVTDPHQKADDSGVLVSLRVAEEITSVLRLACDYEEICYCCQPRLNPSERPMRRAEDHDLPSVPVLTPRSTSQPVDVAETGDGDQRMLPGPSSHQCTNNQPHEACLFMRVELQGPSSRCAGLLEWKDRNYHL